MKKGVGLACIHYATEPTLEKGETEWLQWIGGAFEVNWSVNPHWNADFAKLPRHPITQGVKPFSITDEWYFPDRFPEEMKGVMPILTTAPRTHHEAGEMALMKEMPPVREAVKKGEPQHVAWAIERSDGGRGFGFTGAHFHRNWGNENFRKLVLNALLWTAKVEVPSDGVQCQLTPEDLKQNLDPKGKR